MANYTDTETLLSNLIDADVDARATELALVVLSGARNRALAMRDLADYLASQYDTAARTADGELGYGEMRQYRAWVRSLGARDGGIHQWSVDCAVLAGPGSHEWTCATRAAIETYDAWVR